MDTSPLQGTQIDQMERSYGVQRSQQRRHHRRRIKTVERPIERPATDIRPTYAGLGVILVTAIAAGLWHLHGEVLMPICGAVVGVIRFGRM